ADRTLLNYDYSPQFSIEKMESNLSNLNKEYLELSRLSLENLDNVDLSVLKLDDYSSNLIEQIEDLRIKVIDADYETFQQKKALKNSLSKEIIHVHNQKA